MTKSPRTRKWLLSMALALSVGAVGCGQSAPATSAKSSTAPTQAASPTAQPKLQTVTMAFPIFNLFGSPILLAQKLGYFKAHGIDMKIVTLQGSPASNGALVSGSAQFAATNSLGVFVARQKGVPLVAVVGIDQGEPFEMAVSKTAAAQAGITPSTPINTMLKDMKGWKIGVSSPGSTPALMFKGLLSQAGLPASWVTFLGISSGPGMVTALGHGEVQGYFTDFPTPEEAVAQGTGFVAFKLNSVPAIQSIQGDVVVATDSYARSHPDTVRAVAAAIAEADTFLAQHPHQAAQDLVGVFPHLTAAQLEQGLADYGWQKGGAMTATLWQNAAQLYYQWHIVPKPIPASAIQAAYTLEYLPTP